MARPAVKPTKGIHVRPGRWTAQRALAELPETNDVIIEVIDGSLLASPRGGSDHANAIAELVTQGRPAAKAAGYRMYSEVNLMVGEELLIPDLRVEFRGDDPVMLLHELVDGEYRPIVVAAAGTTFTMHEPFEFAIDPVELLDR